MWKGAVRKHDGDAYAEYMQKTGIAAYASTRGNRGVWMLRRDIETAVFYPEDDRYLVERDQLSAHYLVDQHISPPDRDEVSDPGQIVRDHVAAFNAHDLDHLLLCFSADATWITGSDRFSGTAALAKLFASAFSELSPRLTILSMVIDGDHVACELSEQLAVDGKTRVDHIAGFYRVQSERITTAKIYREGSADP
jgi:uncharacterized protein